MFDVKLIGINPFIILLRCQYKNKSNIFQILKSALLSFEIHKVCEKSLHFVTHYLKSLKKYDTPPHRELPVRV